MKDNACLHHRISESSTEREHHVATIDSKCFPGYEPNDPPRRRNARNGDHYNYTSSWGHPLHGKPRPRLAPTAGTSLRLGIVGIRGPRSVTAKGVPQLGDLGSSPFLPLSTAILLLLVRFSRSDQNDRCAVDLLQHSKKETARCVVCGDDSLQSRWIYSTFQLNVGILSLYRRVVIHPVYLGHW